MEAARGLILWFWGYVMQVTAEVDYQVPSMAGEAARGPIGGDRANRGGLSRDLTQGEGANMTIVSLVTIHPNPGVKWVDLQKQIKKACDLARKHGAENVTVLATMIGGGDQHHRRALLRRGLDAVRPDPAGLPGRPRDADRHA